MTARALRLTRAGAAAPAALAVAAAVVLPVLLRVPLLGGGQVDFDEGVYWESLRALAAGHPLFSSVYSSQPPAFLLAGLPAQLAGRGIAGDRLVVLLLALAGAAAAARIAWVLDGPAPALIAAGVLAADPLWARQSVVLQADGPCTALALVALAAAVESRRADGRRALVVAALAGAVLAAAVLTKLLAVAAGPAVLLVLVAPGGRPAGRVGAAVAGGVAASAALLLPFAGALPVMWRQAVGLHLGARALPIGGLDDGTRLRELPLAVLGTAGCVAALRRAPLLAGAGAAWAAAAAAVLLVQHPLWPHHAVVLAAPLALLSAGAARLVAGRRPLALVTAAGLAAAAVVSTLYVASLQQPDSVLAPSVAALRSGTAPDELVITDDQYAVALAGRDTPPALVDTSLVRIRSGDLGAAQVESAAAQPDVGAVLLATDRLDRLPGLRAWLAAHVGPPRALPGGRVLYLRHRPPLTSA